MKLIMLTDSGKVIFDLAGFGVFERLRPSLFAGEEISTLDFILIHLRLLKSDSGEASRRNGQTVFYLA